MPSCSPRPNRQLQSEASHFVPLPVGSDLEYAIVGTVPFQLLAYYLAVAKGMDPDYRGTCRRR